MDRWLDVWISWLEWAKASEDSGCLHKAAMQTTRVGGCILPRADDLSHEYPSVFRRQIEKHCWLPHIIYMHELVVRFTWYSLHSLQKHTTSVGIGVKQIGKQTEFNNNEFHAIENYFFGFLCFTEKARIKRCVHQARRINSFWLKSKRNEEIPFSWRELFPLELSSLSCSQLREIIILRVSEFVQWNSKESRTRIRNREQRESEREREQSRWKEATTEPTPNHPPQQHPLSYCQYKQPFGICFQLCVSALYAR